jgi:hypothetical protein
VESHASYRPEGHTCSHARGDPKGGACTIRSARGSAESRAR